MATNVKKMVELHVLTNASELVSQLNQQTMDYAEQLFPVMSRDDFETPAAELGYLVVEGDTDIGFYLLHPSVDGKRFEEGTFFTMEEAWEEAVNLEGIEPYVDEAFEHYIVSEWLAAQLEKRGEMIINDFLGLIIWGRTTSGEAVYLDQVMIDIAKNTNL